MNFDLNEQQQQFFNAISGFADRYLREESLARAHDADFPWEVARRMADQGILGITIPNKDGGQGGTLMDAVLAIEAIAAVCPRSADVVHAGNFGAIRVLAEYGSPDQKDRFLAPALKAKRLMTLAMTEPNAGSAVTELQTSATPHGQGFRINGTKIFTTHGRHADAFLVYVRFGPGLDGIGSVIIERGASGFTTGQSSRFLSGEQWYPLYFDDVYIPQENVIFGRGGFKKQIEAFNAERIGNAARALALGQYAYDAAREHAQIRQQFGRPLCEFQGIQWKFADLRMKMDAARLLLYRAAVNADVRFPSAMDTAIAKAYCNLTGFEACSEAMQIMGGAGFCEDLLVEYCFRRTRGWMIAGGSIEILKNKIAEGVFNRTFSQRSGT